MTKVYFLTGANRGLGLEFSSQISSQPDTFLIATTRDPAKSTELTSLAEKRRNIKVIQLDVSSEKSINDLDTILPEVAPDGIDYFISNAGIMSADASKDAIEVPRSTWMEHYTINALGPVMLTSKLYPYLKKKEIKVVYFLSSSLGCIEGFLPMSFSAYGQSKAALNYSTKTLSLELAPQGFIVVAAHPGVVNTDLGRDGASDYEKKDPATADVIRSLLIEPEYSVSEQLKLIGSLTAEDSGKFFNYDRTVLTW